MLDRIDALVVTGGAFDVDPALYGDATRHATVTLKEDRTAAELALVQGALARDMPVLGICGGEQLAGGGARRHADPAHPRRDRPTRWPTSSPTRATSPATRSPSCRGTLLHRIVGATRCG